MTAKEFCLKHQPTLRIESHRTRGFNAHTYYLTRLRGNQMWFSEGKTASEAWINASRSIAKYAVCLLHHNAGANLKDETSKYHIICDGVELSCHKSLHRAWIIAAEKLATTN